jgi:hypothetical protein
VSTTGFITQFLKSATPEAALRSLLAWCLCALTVLAVSPAYATELTQLKMERSEEGVYLSASVQFDLPPVVEDALLKGIPMFFVAEADIVRNRWYWYDKRITSATRTMRLAYQPLTRRWRLNVLSGAISVTGLRLARWRIADAAEVDAALRHKVEFRFRLDLSQLPRPFQIGVAGQKDWTIAVETNRELIVETIREAPKDVGRDSVKDPVKEASK